MTASRYIDSVRLLPLNLANDQIEDFCGISNFFSDGEDFCRIQCADRFKKAERDEYGDWQTSMKLALSICNLLKEAGVDPQIIVEPTCGKGHFILAALQTFDNIEEIYGIEIYKPYLDELKISILQYFLDTPSAKKVKIKLFHQNVFRFDFTSIKKHINGREVLSIGNPPWVTNSKLGVIQSDNLPMKSNFKKVKGIDAITGKGNFDVAEYICGQMFDFLKGENATLAFLIKNSVIKNLIYEQKKNQNPITFFAQYNIDTKGEFGASVAAALLVAKMGGECRQRCVVRDFYSLNDLREYGWVDNNFVSDIASYKQYCYMDGRSSLTWWSGIKHDCSKVMELSFKNGKFVNGFGQTVDIEEDLIYPLIKSSDIKKEQIVSTRKYVIVTQKAASESTDWIHESYPLTYNYLVEHAMLLDERKSSIYRNRPRFCLFGIGDYSFKRYKVVVSGLYKEPRFSLVGEIDGKPAMLDDTCYLLGFDNYKEAYVTLKLLNSHPVQSFIRSLLFVDAKRVINKDLLMRIDLKRIADCMTCDDFDIDESDWEKFVSYIKSNSISTQYELFS